MYYPMYLLCKYCVTEYLKENIEDKIKRNGKTTHTWVIIIYLLCANLLNKTWQKYR